MKKKSYKENTIKIKSGFDEKEYKDRLKKGLVSMANGRIRAERVLEYHKVSIVFWKEEVAFYKKEWEKTLKALKTKLNLFKTEISWKENKKGQPRRERGKNEKTNC